MTQRNSSSITLQNFRQVTTLRLPVRYMYIQCQQWITQYGAKYYQTVSVCIQACLFLFPVSYFFVGLNCFAFLVCLPLTWLLYYKSDWRRAGHVAIMLSNPGTSLTAPIFASYQVYYKSAGDEFLVILYMAWYFHTMSNKWACGSTTILVFWHLKSCDKHLQQKPNISWLEHLEYFDWQHLNWAVRFKAMSLIKSTNDVVVLAVTQGTLLALILSLRSFESSHLLSFLFSLYVLHICTPLLPLYRGLSHTDT